MPFQPPPRPAARDPYQRDGGHDPYQRDPGRDPYQRDPGRDPYQREPGPDPYQRDPGRDPYPRDVAGRDPYPRDSVARDPYQRDLHAPRHLADSWEGPVSLNRPLPSRRHGLQWLLALPIIPPLLVPLYNRIEPKLFGLPFFYWFQLACVAFTVVTVTLVYQLTKGRRPRWPR